MLHPVRTYNAPAASSAGGVGWQITCELAAAVPALLCAVGP